MSSPDEAAEALRQIRRKLEAGREAEEEAADAPADPDEVRRVSDQVRRAFFGAAGYRPQIKVREAGWVEPLPDPEPLGPLPVIIAEPTPPPPRPPLPKDVRAYRYASLQKASGSSRRARRATPSRRARC